MKSQSIFTSRDLEQIAAQGTTPEQVMQQIEQFSRGFPPLPVTAPATINHGIKTYNEAQINAFITEYEQSLSSLRVLKFVPASGAATRMFKELFDFLNRFPTDDQYKASQHEIKPTVQEFFNHLHRFAFYPLLKETCHAQGTDLGRMIENRDYVSLLKLYLLPGGMGYGQLPKGLILFHSYPDHNRTAMEEHLVEGAEYCKTKNGEAPLHFTVSKEHQAAFEKRLEEVRGRYEKKYGVQYNVTFSQQESSTDTLAVDMENRPFRDSSGHLVFRPGGHGALLSNLNRFACDVLFIKNIDNVTTDTFSPTTFRFKKMLGGVLLHYRKKIYNYLYQLEKNNSAILAEVLNFLQDELCIVPPESFNSFSTSQKMEYCFAKLNRPIRVCGMVKNEGDTGGGPFWAKNPDGTLSLQIAETSQLDLTDESVKKIFHAATHFNPADFALCTLDYKGQKFDLMKYRNPDTGFISKKSKDGRDLKALELPGLWNGSMADWNTLFVDVPLITFNPVKTVNDLLKKEHTTD